MQSSAPATVRVWDPWVRLAHGAFIAGIVAAWLTRHARGSWHEWIGYAVAAVLVLRLLWGLAGPDSARFARFVRGPRATLAYARAVASGRAPRHLGHNPLGAWMVVALLASIAVVSITGWMSTTDRWWGVAWVADLHLWSAQAFFVLVPLHVLGALHASRAHGENLVAAMCNGRKRGAQAGDVAP
jgi:cytochrome b